MLFRDRFREPEILPEPLRRSNRLGPRGFWLEVVAGGGSRSSLGIMRATIPSLAFAALVLDGCGARFGPGYSLDDKHYFASRPHIAVHTNTTTYGLRWQYGSMGFYFQPRAKVVSGQLLFSLQGTSSTGSRSGLYEELPISDPVQIQILLSGGAFWLEPDGTKVSLTLTNL